MIKFIVIIFCSYCLGFYSKRLFGVGKSIYFHLKHKICFRYKPTGYRETRDGTNSDFCQRCGHPAGYHRI